MKITLIAILLGLYTSSPVFACTAFCTDGGKNDTTALLREMNREFEAGLRKQDQTTEINPSNVEVFEIEEEIELGFDTSEYLPAGFDPLAGKIASYDMPELIQVEEGEFDLGFDPGRYLPRGFDPYSGTGTSK